jgi:hypothetical protein
MEEYNRTLQYNIHVQELSSVGKGDLVRRDIMNTYKFLYKELAVISKAMILD